MKVKFIQIENPEKIEYKINWQLHYNQFPLIIEKEYIVYAIEFYNDNKINFFIFDESGNIYPKNYPSEFFEIIDNRLSKYWEGIFEHETYPLKKITYPDLITFKEWRENKYFEEEMMENTNNANEVFKKYKNLIDNEYPDKSLLMADIIMDKWIMCKHCPESWESSSIEGIVVCPKCKKRLNNPLWTKE